MTATVEGRPHPTALRVELAPWIAEIALAKLDRFVERDTVTGCLLWTGPRIRRGAGVVWLPVPPRYKKLLVRRVAWALYHGHTPAGLMVCATCDRELCIEEAHLYLATPLRRVRDMIGKERHPHLFAERCAAGHPFSAENTRHYVGADGNPRRACRACDLLAHQRYNERLREAGTPRTHRGRRAAHPPRPALAEDEKGLP